MNLYTISCVAYSVAMYPVPPCPSAVIPNRSSPPAVLLRKTWRGIRRQTLANLSKVPKPVVDAIRAFLQGGVGNPRRCRRHPEVAATRACGGPARLGDPTRSSPHPQPKALPPTRPRTGRRHRTPHPPGLEARHRQSLVPRAPTAASGPCSASGASLETSCSTCSTGSATANPGSNASSQHHPDSTVTSTYLEGQQCPLAAFGHNRDGKKGKKQMVFGLLCAADGCPVAVEVFPGNTAGPRWPPRSARSGTTAA